MPVNQVRSRSMNGGGRPPDEDPDIARALVQAWADAYIDEGKDFLVMEPGFFLRASDAGACARALGYRIRRRKIYDEIRKFKEAHGYEPDEGEDDDQVILLREAIVGISNPPTVADRYRMNTGSLVHEELAKHLAHAFGPMAEAEVVTVRPAEPGISMHVDAVVKEPDCTTVVEVKTINGFGFKDTIGVAKKDVPARGPRSNAVVQGALAAVEHKADRLVILVFSLELVGNQIAERNGLDDLGKMVAQFSFTPEEFTPIAEREHKRMKAALTLVEQGTLPPRSIPDEELPHGNRVTDPSNGAWVLEDAGGNIVNLGNTWHCAYCWERDTCLQDGPT